MTIHTRVLQHLLAIETFVMASTALQLNLVMAMGHGTGKKGTLGSIVIQ